MSINGVSLLTKEGRPKSRYSSHERLRVLGGTEEELREFVELFAPRRPLYVITRAGSSDPRDWTTAKGRLRDRDVLEHLLGDILPIPGKTPRWVAPKSWGATRWVGIDVDFRGDAEDFRARCRRVNRALTLDELERFARFLASKDEQKRRHPNAEGKG